MRLIQFPVVLLAVVILNFSLIHLAPGDVASALAGDNPDPEFLAHVRAEYGLDKPFLVQLWRYGARLATGDLGTSFQSHAPVLDDLIPRIVPTLLLVGTALLFAVVLGTALGTTIARKPGSWLDSAASIISISLFSIPVFWLGLMFILFFAVRERWLPTSGMFTVGGPRAGWRMLFDVGVHMVLPVLSLTCVWIGQYVRLARASVVEVLSEPYIATVRAVGFSERRVLGHYALRTALLPVVTVLGLQIGVVLTGAVLTESVFSWPGLGSLIFAAILARDTPVIMGAFVLMSVAVAVASLLTDLFYAVLDPRVGY